MTTTIRNRIYIKCVLLALLYFAIANSSTLYAQQLPSLAESCQTMQMYKDHTNWKEGAAEFPKRKNGTQKSNANWSLFNGYSSFGNCSETCDTYNNGTMNYDNAPPYNSCGTVTNTNTNFSYGTYQVPIAFTIVRDCSGNMPSSLNNGPLSNVDLIARLDQQIADANEFFACQDFPVQLYKCTNHGQATEFDNSTRIITDATLCNFTGSIGAGSDNNYANGVDIPNLLNIYVPEQVNNSDRCNGFAFLPYNVNSPKRMVMQVECFEGIDNFGGLIGLPSDPCNDPAIAAVFIHEFGHFLGLFHTHAWGVNDDGTELIDGCQGPGYGQGEADCCITGDLVCDTDADPNLYGFGSTSCTDPSNAGAQYCVDDVADLSDCNQPASCGGGAYTFLPNTSENIMSYNVNIGCQNKFSECQKAKMLDALTNVYFNMCCPDPARFFSNTNDTQKQICVGDPIPTFNADAGDCYNWYSSATGGNLLNGSPVSSFTPPAWLVDVNTPGTYYVYLEEANNYQDNCRVAVSITVVNTPSICGSGSNDCTDDISLGANWNLISSACRPSSPDMQNVWAPIVSDVIQVKSLGAVYLPSIPLNQIGNWDVTQGYLVKMNNPRTLTINGTNVDIQTELMQLQAGWNIISYLGDAPADINTALGILMPYVIQVKTLNGLFIPGLVNTIGNMQPGQGYQIKLSIDFSFYYPSNLAPRPEGELILLEPTHYAQFDNISPFNATLSIQANEDTWLSEGDEIAVYNQSGMLVGSTVFQNGTAALLIYGDDPSTETIDGLQNNESYTVKLWQKDSQTEQILDLEFLQGSDKFEQDGLNIAQLKTTHTAINSLTQDNGLLVYPNPTNKRLNVQLGSTQNEVQSMSIYNLEGKLIRQLEQNNLATGTTLSLDVSDLSEGLYYLQVNTPNGPTIERFSVMR